MAMAEKIADITDLAPMMWVCVDSAEGDKAKIEIGPKIYRMLSYMFSIPMREQEGDGPYRFTDGEVAAIESQLDGVSMRILEFGEIYVGTMLLLTNSPRCPYTLHTNTVFYNGNHAVYFRLILKRNIVLDGGTFMT